jgi:nitroreductase
MINVLLPEVERARKADYPIDPVFLNRWSPRAMSGESLTDEELMPLFEAARWAPSSYNAQQRRFLYAKRNTQNWNVFFDLLVDANKIWAKNAAVLVVVISRKNFEHNEKPSRTSVFDTGAAWENLALQGCLNGLVVHGMQGFDYEKARSALAVPDNYEVCAMIAIGKKGNKEDLPENLRKAEQPSGRRPLKEIAIEGTFRGK